MANGVSTYEMANLFREILGMVARALQRLGHENDLQAGLALQTFGIFDVSKKNKISQPVHLSIGA